MRLTETTSRDGHQDGCPSRDDLESLLNGMSPSIGWDALNAHLETCGRCETTLDGLSEMSDAGVRMLSALPPTDEDEPEFRALHARLMSTPMVFSGDETMDGLADDTFDDDPFSSTALPVTVGQYELIEPIGAGATGTVFKARHLQLDREVAIKILSRRRSMDRDSVDRFRQEVRAIGQLEHPNIVHATDAGQFDGRHFLVMEFAEGANLSELLQSHGPLSTADACEVIRQAALGLAYAHDQQMVHRDVKLSNLLLTANGTVKLLDLGLVAVQSSIGSPDDSTAGDGPRGTADYMSPEQWTQYHAVDPRSDLYSLGCTLFKLLTGSAPFFRLPEGCESKREAHLSYPVPDLLELRPDVPAHLLETVTRLLAKQPNDRIQTAAEVATRVARIARTADLPALVADAGLHERELRNRVRSMPPIYQRRKFIYGATAALTLGAIANWQGRLAGWRKPEIDYEHWRTLSLSKPKFLRYGASPSDASMELDANAANISQYDAANGRLTINSEKAVLVNLGRPTRGVFSLAATLQQSPWRGNAGLFFAYQMVRGRVSYDTLLVFDNEAETGAPRRIVWQEHRVGRNDDGVVTTDHPLAEAELPPTDGESVTLMATLGRSGMLEVFFQDKRIADVDWVLSFKGRQRQSLAAERRKTAFLGSLGVVCGWWQTEIQNVKLKYHAYSS